mgnify:CR=1 FL=1
MGYTKQQLIDGAFAEIGLATYVFDIGAEQQQAALRRLDGMMAEWNARGVRLGYPLSGSPQDSVLTAESNVPDSAWEAIVCNLAIRIAPSYGKTPTPETKATAKSAYNAVLSLSAMPSEMQLPGTLPAGAGNKPWRYDQPFLVPPVNPIEAGGDGPLEFN